jgi:hypothetical protein
MRSCTVLVATVMALPLLVHAAEAPRPELPAATVETTISELVTSHGQAQEARIRTGVTQVAARWWPQDGDARAFQGFCTASFLADPAQVHALAARLESVLEQVDGHLHEVRRGLMTPLELETGPILKVDELLSGLDLQAHVDEDLFATKVAFLVLLNFPVRTLAEVDKSGATFDRTTWAETRLAQRFADRVPAAVSQEITRATTSADSYIAGYNIRMGNLRDAHGKALFPEDLRLISHWGLRDELKSWYGKPGGLERQRLIVKVMERIVRQEIPLGAIDHEGVAWRPDANELTPASPKADAIPAAWREREPDTRYAHILDNFHAMRQADPYTETTPTAIARAFELGRQMSEKQVESLLLSVLASPEVKATGALIARRLGRPLEPFDIWYPGFQDKGPMTEVELDRIVASRYPTAAAFQADLPRILTVLGFAPAKATWLAEHIVVDPSRGAGHAMGAVRREDQAHLRTRVGPGGMNYKGFNIAIHELGHCVEQVFSLNGIDHWLLAGVPNTAFTESFAFSFQRRDLEVLSLARPGETDHSAEVLNDLWMTYEIGGVALVDLEVWRYLYAHPDATPAQLRVATLAAARKVWNAYYAPVLGTRDSEILAIYSHMVAYPLYLADYPLGHVISFQVATKLRGEAFGAEFERMARQGRITPDAWMRGAVGGPVSTAGLLEEARKALGVVK